MDATHDVGPESPHTPLPASEEEGKTAESLREEIEATSRILHDHVDELKERVQHRIDSLRNPLGLHDRLVERPLAACGVAFLAGMAVGVLRGNRGLHGAARRVGSSLGSSFASQLASRLLDRMVTTSRPL
jgi:ElaB/YqjD/DUF883 family membrane-anchored ribosome-binding protein